VLYGLANGLDWPTTGRIASLLGALKIGADGTQNHRFTREEFRRRYREAFGSDVWAGLSGSPLVAGRDSTAG